MNKEFKKLLEQSYTKGFEECARTGHKVGDLDVIFNSIVMGEFAELIVRECLKACSGANEITYLVPPSKGQVVVSCMREIEKHFGVKE